MGIELIFGIASLAVGVISGVNQMNSANETKKATDKAVKKEKEAVKAKKEVNKIQTAQQTITGLEERRQKIREERVRRAAMLSASEAVGGSGSSGESGAASALSTNLASLVGFQQGATKANQGMNKYEQKALDLGTESNSIMAMARARAGEADAFSSFLGVFQTGFNAFGSMAARKNL